MKTYARLENNIVCELYKTDQDIKELFTGDLVWVEANASVVEGQVFVDGQFKNKEKSHEELCQEETQWRNFELVNADIELNKVQDGDPKAIGTVSDWRNYRKALRAYTESETFPDKSSRPVGPRG